MSFINRIEQGLEVIPSKEVEQSMRVPIAPPQYVDFVKSSEWDWYVFTKKGVVVSPKQQLVIKTVRGSGYIYAAIVQSNSPDLIFITKAYTPYGLGYMEGHIGGFKDLGITAPNPAIPYVTVYDPANNNYVIAFSPGFPGLPFNTKSEVILYNPSASPISANIWGWMIITRGSVIK